MYYGIFYNLANPEVVTKKKEEIQTTLQIFEEKLQSKYFAGQFLTRCSEELLSFHSTVEQVLLRSIHTVRQRLWLRLTRIICCTCVGVHMMRQNIDFISEWAACISMTVFTREKVLSQSLSYCVNRPLFHLKLLSKMWAYVLGIHSFRFITYLKHTRGSFLDLKILKY